MCVSGSVVPDSLPSHGLQPARLLCLWDFPGKDTEVICHFLFQEIFLTQGSNPGLLHCRQIPYWLSYQGSLHVLIQIKKMEIYRYRFVRSRARHYWQNGGTAPTPSPHPADMVPGWRSYVLWFWLVLSFLQLSWLERMLRGLLFLREAWESTKPSAVVPRK